MSRRHGFTLLEILLAIVIGLLLMGIAVPSVIGLVREQELKRSSEGFDDFVRRVQARAVSESRTLVMVWDDRGIEVASVDVATTGEKKEGERFSFPEKTTWALVRPAALVKKPAPEWPFWRTGACEPVMVNYEGPEGTWSMEFNGLTGRGKMAAMEVK